MPAQLDTVIDATTARPKLGSVGGDNGLRSEGSWDGPPGRPPRGPNGDATGDGPAADPLVDSESGSAVDAAVDAVGDVDADVDEVAAAAAESFEPVASIEESPNLSGYEAYGHTPAPGPRLSRDELVQKYAHLVKYVVGRLGVSVPGLFDHEDAMQAGVLGLLRAIDAYRPDAAASFESYAILRIRGAILDAVRSLDTVGRAGREAARAIQGAIRDLQHELGRSPNETEIATRLNMPIARYRERLQAASVVTISLDEHDSRDSDDESVALADSAPDPNAVDPADEAARRDAIASLIHEIGRLSERPRMVLSLYYQDEMTFKEIGQVLGVTESRVCQIHTEAILALRTRLVDPDVAARLGRRRARP
jgi:RNA polymerase sigma factor for flagellar operon FliA